MSKEFYTAKIVVPAIISDIRSKRGENKMFLSVGDHLPDVIFRYEKGELIADDLSLEQFNQLAGVYGVEREGEVAPVRDLSDVPADHYATLAAEKKNNGMNSNSPTEMLGLLAALTDRLTQHGIPIPSAPAVIAQAPVSRQQLANAKLDPVSLAQVIAILENNGETVDTEQSGWQLLAYAAAAKIAKADQATNETLLEIIDASSLRAEIAALADKDVVHTIGEDTATTEVPPQPTATEQLKASIAKRGAKK